MKNLKFRIAYLLSVLIGLGLIYSMASPSMQIPLTLSESQMAALVGADHLDYAKCRDVWGCGEPDGCHNMGTWSYYSLSQGNGKDCEYNSSKWCERSTKKVRVCYRRYYNVTGCTGSYNYSTYDAYESCIEGSM